MSKSMTPKAIRGEANGPWEGSDDEAYEAWVDSPQGQWCMANMRAMGEAAVRSADAAITEILESAYQRTQRET